MSYKYTLPDGKQMTQDEWDEHKKQKIEAEILAEWKDQHEAARLVAALSESYKACTGFMKSRPHLVRKVGDDQAQENDLYLKLRKNLERADRAPRCEKVREDGTECGSPRMKGYNYCYSHDRMLQVRPRKLALPPLEDANGIQMAIMLVQKALIDDEISDKRAGLLLYSIQIAAANVKNTTFTHSDKKVVTEMPEEPLGSWPLAISKSEGNTYYGEDGSGDLEISGSDNQLAGDDNLHHDGDTVSGSGDRIAGHGNLHHADTEAQRGAGSGNSKLETSRGETETGKGFEAGDLEIAGAGDREAVGTKKKPKSDPAGSRESGAEQISHPLAKLGDSR